MDAVGTNTRNIKHILKLIPVVLHLGGKTVQATGSRTENSCVQGVGACLPARFQDLVGTVLELEMKLRHSDCSSKAATSCGQNAILLAAIPS